MGKAHFRAKQYNMAEKSFKKALKYTSSPTVLKALADCQHKLGKQQSCIKSLKIVNYMKPHHLWPKILLMRENDYWGDTINAIHYANDVLNTKVKIPSLTASEYQAEASKYIRGHQMAPE